MAYRDWSSFVRPAFVETGIDHTLVLSPIAHVSSLHSCVTSSPVPTTSFDSHGDDILLASLLNRSPPRSMFHDSVSSEYTFYSVTGDPVLHQTPVPHRCFHREGPFMAQIPHPHIGDPNGGCTFRCT